ncbi:MULTISPECIES: HP1 family phage holin [Shewanella]|uniref:Holin family HP1 protein n=1 Tax=Shewanella chilikensis TaxID=558541 RepID=A0ABX5PTA8_9GAMM|nr:MULTISPECIES: HP1 family phage holin [Shewanella]MBO2550989.1 hypothetical protein [Shewanella algae]MBO2665189.1 hypothetical protein [Shewanella algae]MCL1154803.1 phage holin family protein [Shewanella chilikensis]MDO8254814.1 HP1 family phage holin [Shewanella algae]PST68888.1 hypothetical protein AYI77_01970 [Shewanella algae]
MSLINSDAATQKGFSIASYLSSLLSAIGGALTLNDIAVLLGIVLALFTWAVNWLYQFRRDRRDAERHSLETKLLNAQLEKLDGS